MKAGHILLRKGRLVAERERAYIGMGFVSAALRSLYFLLLQLAPGYRSHSCLFAHKDLRNMRRFTRL